MEPIDHLFRRFGERKVMRSRNDERTSLRTDVLEAGQKLEDRVLIAPT